MESAGFPSEQINAVTVSFIVFSTDNNALYWSNNNHGAAPDFAENRLVE